MNPIVRNILAVVAGFALGSVVNMGLVQLGHGIFPLPEGTDTSNMKALAEAMVNFGPKEYIFPFLAHALGTLVGAFTAAKIAASHKMKFAMGIGVFFLLGGIYVSTLLPAPMWFEALDIIVAYIPMGWLGGKLAIKKEDLS